MALVEMKCTNCGAPMKASGGKFECEYCGTILLEMPTGVEAERPDVLSVGEFKEKLEEGKRNFVVDFGGEAVADIDAEILKGRLKLAEEELRAGRANKVDEILKSVPDTVFAAERLRLLASVGVADETELAAYAGDLETNGHYTRATKLATPETKETYAYLADVCRQNVEVNAEIAKGREMLSLKMYDKGAEYATRMVSKYPTRARAWELLMEAKCLCDDKYNPFDDLEKFKLCPDAALAVTGGEEDADGIPRGISRVVAERCREVLKPVKSRRAFVSKYIVAPLLTAIGIAAVVGIWKLIEYLTT